MKRILLYSLLILSIAGIWYACKKADDEPIYPTAPISRLYVSFSDEESSETPQYSNVMVIDPADSTIGENQLPAGDSYDTDPKQGAGITFDPTIRRAFQVSRKDSTIKLFNVSELGALTASTSFKDTINLRSGRAIAYHRASDQVIVTDNDNIPSIHIFSNPLRLTGQRKARKRLLLDFQPYGLALSEKADSSMMVSMQGTQREIRLYNLSEISKLPDSTVTVADAEPSARIRINAATDLRGISYSAALDVLVIADVGTLALPGSNPVDGSIYIIENALSKFTTGGAITPDRVISGSNANLMDPVDVAIDDRDDKEHYIYVADRSGRRISRFLLSDEGNIAPNATRQITNPDRTPEFIYLDARPRPDLTENSQ